MMTMTIKSCKIIETTLKFLDAFQNFHPSCHPLFLAERVRAAVKSCALRSGGLYLCGHLAPIVVNDALRTFPVLLIRHPANSRAEFSRLALWSARFKSIL